MTRLYKDASYAPPEMTIDFWHGVFLSRDYEREVGFDSPNRGLIWYSKGDFSIGYDAQEIRELVPPYFVIKHKTYYKHLTLVKSREGNTSRLFERQIQKYLRQVARGERASVEDFMYVIDNMETPANVPLLLGIPWASELASVLLEGDA